MPTFILHGKSQRDLAKKTIDKAPHKAVVNIRESTRSKEQSDKMWAMCTDLARCKPEGRVYSKEKWKILCMKACGHEVRYMNDLNGEPFPYGFSSSKLSVAQMADLITWMYQYGDEHGVQWSEPEYETQAA